MDDALAFRNAMAESGVEYTPTQAIKAMNATEEFIQTIHDGCIEKPEEYERLAKLTVTDKQNVCRQFADHGQEITLDELNCLIDLIMDVSLFD